MDLAAGHQVEELPFRPSRKKRLEGHEPDLYALRRGQALRQPRDDYLRTAVAGELFELGVVRQEYQLFAREPLAQGGIRHAALPQNDYVLGVVAFFSESVVKRERKILVEEELHAAFTAGGWCAATCAAYRNAVRICSRVTW